MKRKLCALTSVVITMSMLAGCGSSAVSTSETATETSAAESTASVEATSSETVSSDTTDSSNLDQEAIDDLLTNYDQDTDSLTIDNSKWQYDSDNNVYYQIGISYCSDPGSTEYETLSIYVPGDYMTGTDNGDGTYTCTINTSGTVGDYTAETAPVVFPVNTPGYVAQTPATEYSYDGLSDYLDAGFIYVFAGMRGRANEYDDDGTLVSSGGIPWGMTDLKAAIRYFRLNASSLPGDSDAVYTFGMSGGGAQSALAGATGDSSLYYDYLEDIGAAMYDADGNYISDATLGSMDWCPITSLDEADEAYEWNMGQFSDDGVRSDDSWTSALSDDMAEQFATYINDLGLTDEDGNVLTLEESDDGIYQAGSYYDYLMGVVETSLNNFLSDTTFPYTESTAFNASGDFGGGGDTGDAGNGITGSGDETTTTDETAETTEMTGDAPSGDAPTGDAPTGGAPGGDTSTSEAATYDTVQDYIDSLNSDGDWVTYDADTNTATITSLEDFVTHCKEATKDVGAFDETDKAQGENELFGTADSDYLHFDSIIANLMEENEETYATYSDWDSTILDSYEADLQETDELGTDMQTRMDMYNPMYYLDDYYDGYNTSNVATYWRIRTGIDQSDTALTTETNLALALESNDSVSSVDFATVWGLGHTMAERTGDSTTNFIEWVNECMADYLSTK